MRVKTWKILDRGDVPRDATVIPFECQCGYEAMLPVLGRVMAVTGGRVSSGDEGVVFDIGPGEIPSTIQCRKCGRVLTTDAAHVR